LSRLGGDVVIDWREHIAVDPAVLVGKPVVRGTRLAVEFILGLVAEGWGFDDLLENYPGPTVADIRACVAYARDVLVEVQVFPVAGSSVGR
jgi:uncharacterized protein (DUF433 family)